MSQTISEKDNGVLKKSVYPGSQRNIFVNTADKMKRKKITRRERERTRREQTDKGRRPHYLLLLLLTPSPLSSLFLSLFLIYLSLTNLELAVKVSLSLYFFYFFLSPLVSFHSFSLLSHIISLPPSLKYFHGLTKHSSRNISND